MNKSNMKGNAGKHVRLFPPALGIGSNAPGQEEWWFIRAVTDQGVDISHAGSRFAPTLPYDHMYSWTEDLNQGGGIKRGALELHVQLIAEGCNIHFIPLERPGQPAPITVQEVASNFPITSGLQERLQQQGYDVRWSFPDRRPVNYQDVIELSGGRLVSFSHRHQVLMKCRKSLRS